MKQYVKIFPSGESKTTRFKPLFQEGEREREHPGENPDVLINGKWWSSVADGGELVVNGTFDTDVSGWTAHNAILTQSNGALIVSDNGGYTQAYQLIPTEIGAVYILEYDVIELDNFAQVRVSNSYDSLDEDGTIYDSGNSTTLGRNIVEIVAQGVSTRFGFGSDGATSATYDNISVFKKEIQPEAPYPTQFTYVSQNDKLATFLIEDGQPVDITFDDDSPSIVQNVIQAKDMVVVDKLKINNTEWLNDGVDYDDPDAIGANPVAKIYPDGTIVGSTDYGSYVKYPNGEMMCFRTTNEVFTTTSGSSFPLSDSITTALNYPVNFTTTPYSNIELEGANHAFIITDSTNPSSNRTWNSFRIGDNLPSSVQYRVKKIAIGRWKL